MGLCTPQVLPRRSLCIQATQAAAALAELDDKRTAINRTVNYMLKDEPPAILPQLYESLESYAVMFQSSCMWKIQPTDRFLDDEGIEHGRDGMVVAQHDIPLGKIVVNLIAWRAIKLTKMMATIRCPRCCSFSEMESGNEQVCDLVGPARFINHSCKPNAEYTWMNSEQVGIRAMEDIPAKTEITVSYRRDYCPPDRDSCQCQHCTR